jgi:hypothetical protein
MAYSRKKWREPREGTHLAHIRDLLLRPDGLTAEDSGDTAPQFSTCLIRLRDDCGYDVRVIGFVPRRQIRGAKPRKIYRIVGRIGFTADQPYQDFLAADLEQDRAA